MDTKPLETRVYVHSPLIEYSVTGGYYTSYAIHLMSNNPCFSRPASHIRRRYSEFVTFRELLISHHPTLKPPSLPPKNYFQRFNDDFIDQRMQGLQKFLTEVLSTPVYLSDKSLHLFLQSMSSMSDICQACLGDIPAPPLINSRVLTTSHTERSPRSSMNSEDGHYTRSLNHLILDDKRIPQSPITIARTSDISKSPGDQCDLLHSIYKNGNKPYLIPKRNGSLDSNSTMSSPSSSPSSLEASYSSSSERAKEQRRVSFNDSVKVAVVTNYGISVLRP